MVNISVHVFWFGYEGAKLICLKCYENGIFRLDEEPYRQLRVILRKKNSFIRVVIHRLESAIQ